MLLCLFLFIIAACPHLFESCCFIIFAICCRSVVVECVLYVCVCVCVPCPCMSSGSLGLFYDCVFIVMFFLEFA